MPTHTPLVYIVHGDRCCGIGEYNIPTIIKERDDEFAVFGTPSPSELRWRWYYGLSIERLIITTMMEKKKKIEIKTDISIIIRGRLCREMFWQRGVFGIRVEGRRAEGTHYNRYLYIYIRVCVVYTCTTHAHTCIRPPPLCVAPRAQWGRRPSSSSNVAKKGARGGEKKRPRLPTCPRATTEAAGPPKSERNTSHVS